MMQPVERRCLDSGTFRDYLIIFEAENGGEGG